MGFRFVLDKPNRRNKPPANARSTSHESGLVGSTWFFLNFVCVPSHMSDTWYEEVDQEDVQH